MSVERDDVAVVEPRELQLTLRELHVPGRNIPAGMWIHVFKVLGFYGVAAEPVEVISALYDVVNKTPIARGGRLRPDGTVDRDLDLKDDRDDSGRPIASNAPAYTCIFNPCAGQPHVFESSAAAEEWMDEHARTVAHPRQWPITFRIDYPSHPRFPATAYREPVKLIEDEPHAAVANDAAVTAERPWVVRAVWCNSSPTYYGGFTCADDANAWAKRRLDGDIACIGYEVEQLLGQGDSPDEIVESLTRSGLVD